MWWFRFSSRNMERARQTQDLSGRGKGKAEAFKGGTSVQGARFMALDGSNGKWAGTDESPREPRLTLWGCLHCHQPPEVNYWAVLTFGEIKQEEHSQVHPAGEIDICEKLDIDDFWWLVVSTQGSALRSSAPGGWLDVIRKEAWSCCRTISSVRLCWKLEEPKGTKGAHAAGRREAGSSTLILVHASLWTPTAL
jgi:hypothetical protein